MDRHFYSGFIKRAQDYGLSAIEADNLVKRAGRAAFRKIEEKLKTSTPEQQRQILDSIHRTTTAHAERAGNPAYQNYVTSQGNNNGSLDFGKMSPGDLYSRIYPNETFPMSSHNGYKVPTSGFLGFSNHPFNNGTLSMYDTAHNFEKPPVFTGHERTTDRGHLNTVGNRFGSQVTPDSQFQGLDSWSLESHANPFSRNNPLYETVIDKGNTRTGNLIPERIFQPVSEGGKSLRELNLPMDGSKLYKGLSADPGGRTAFASNNHNSLNLQAINPQTGFPDGSFLSGDPRVSGAYALGPTATPNSQWYDSSKPGVFETKWEEIAPKKYVGAVHEDINRTLNNQKYSDLTPRPKIIPMASPTINPASSPSPNSTHPLPNFAELLQSGASNVPVSELPLNASKPTHVGTQSTVTRNLGRFGRPAAGLLGGLGIGWLLNKAVGRTPTPQIK